jgi:hypothetical protein
MQRYYAVRCTNSHTGDEVELGLQERPIHRDGEHPVDAPDRDHDAIGIACIKGGHTLSEL